METKEKTLYSAIPMRTWRWLGVNEACAPDDVAVAEKTADGKSLEEPVLHKTVAAGEERTETLLYRTEQTGRVVIDVAAGGKLHLTKIQLLPTDKGHVDTLEINVADGGEAHVTIAELGASRTVTKVQINLDGDSSLGDLAAVYLGSGSQQVDLNYVICQKGRKTRADMQVRGALMGRSDKIFRGTLDFRKGSKGSVGREREEVVLLNEGVRNRSVPLMLSGEDDVDGHHAVSVGKMDQEKLFYVMSRGLDLAEAQRLVVEASFNPVLERITDKDLRAEVEHYIEELIADGK
jgi:Fe-S cluster assembly protein SufD